jgi:hypothetical protein
MDPFFLDLLKSFLQSAFLLGAFLVAIWFYFRMASTRMPHPITQDKPDPSMGFTVKLQACERLILFLERISFNQLILRVHTGQMTVTRLEQLLVKSVRDEYDYNLSQQLYVSSATWDKIRHACENTLRMIHATASRLSPEAAATELANQLVKEVISSGKSPVQDAIDAVKKEIQPDYGV